MSEWWTYSPHDFLMYSARAYYRLFGVRNARIWPGEGLVCVLVFVFVFVLVLVAVSVRRGRTPFAFRAALAGLAAGWGFVAASYFIIDYSTIHTFARFFAGMFALEGGLLLVAAWRLNATPVAVGMRARVGWIILSFALFAQPFVGIAFGRPWRQAELFAIAPDPTVAATFGVLLLRGRSPWWLWVVPVVWTAYNGATLQMLGSPDALMLPATALAALAARATARSTAARTA